jgi:hypothetical protein
MRLTTGYGPYGGAIKALRGDLLTTVAILAVVANMLWFMP